MQDQTLICKDCGKSFVWTASEQEFYQSKGFSAPVRCQDCRRKLKEQKQGGRPHEHRAPREMHQITCAQCGAQGEVPFKPRDPQNVLCADCFRKKRAEEMGEAVPAATPAPVASNDDAAVSAADDSAMSDDTSDSSEE